MNRLTKRFSVSNETAVYDDGTDTFELVACGIDPEWCERWKEGYECACDNVGDAVNKLGRYESTGLTPNRCAELARAQQEGWLVVLPCKPGDLIYNPSPVTVDDYENDITEYVFTGAVLIGVDCAERGAIYTVPISMFGKTLFLSRAEAEETFVKKSGPCETCENIQTPQCTKESREACPFGRNNTMLSERTEHDEQ